MMCYAYVGTCEFTLLFLLFFFGYKCRIMRERELLLPFVLPQFVLCRFFASAFFPLARWRSTCMQMRWDEYVGMDVCLKNISIENSILRMSEINFFSFGRKKNNENCNMVLNEFLINACMCCLACLHVCIGTVLLKINFFYFEQMREAHSV